MALVVKNIEEQDKLVKSSVALPLKNVLKKSNKERNAIPKSGRSLAKGYRIFVWFFIIFFPILGLLGFTKATNSVRYNEELLKTIQSMNKELTTLRENNINEKKVDSYFSNFLPIYFNVDSSNMDSQAQREEKLAEYFIDTGALNMYIEGNRKLLDYQLFDVFPDGNGQWLAQYEVTYSASDKSGADSKDYTHLMNIPFVYDEKSFAITEYPYFTTIQNQDGLVELTQNNLADSNTEVEEAEKEEIEVFLEQFFNNYVSSEEADMIYLMEQPESLKGEFNYISSDNKIYSDKDGWIVKAIVTFGLPNTEFKNVENMTLDIIKKDDKYFVKKLTHTLGGN